MYRREIGIVQQENVVRIDVAGKPLYDPLHRKSSACDMLAHSVSRAQEIPVGSIKRCHVVALLGGINGASNPFECYSCFLRDLVKAMRYDFECDWIFTVAFRFHPFSLISMR